MWMFCFIDIIVWMKQLVREINSRKKSTQIGDVTQVYNVYLQKNWYRTNVTNMGRVLLG